MVRQLFQVYLQQNKICFLCLFQFLLFILSNFRAIQFKVKFFGQKQAIFSVGIRLKFSLLPSILTFDFDLILVSFLGPNGLFWSQGRVQRMSSRFLMWTSDYYFLSFSLFLVYHVVSSLCGGDMSGGMIVVQSDNTVSSQTRLCLFCC